MSSRLQLALNVSDLETAIAFYSKLFATEPAKRRPGYANFAVADPPLKLVLFEAEHGGSLNHLGIEVSDPAEIPRETARLRGAGLDTLNEDGVSCCHAVQDKVWVDGPDRARWEIYAVLGDSQDLQRTVVQTETADGSCACSLA